MRQAELEPVKRVRGVRTGGADYCRPSGRSDDAGTDFGNLHILPASGELDGPWTFRRILVEREMSASPGVIVLEVAGQRCGVGAFRETKNVIQTTRGRSNR